MKYIKILALMVGILGFTACGDFDPTPESPDTNTASGVTVSMKQPEITFMESKGIVRVPVVVDGTPNGYVTATCTIQEYTDNGSEAAIDFIHYMVSSQTINIADEDKSGYFEVKLIDDRFVNEQRNFLITLVDAQGAEIGNVKSTVVHIEDNDDRPYDRLDGGWYMHYDGTKVRQVSLMTWDTEHWAYGYSYQLWGVVGENSPYEDDATEDEKMNSGAYPILVMFNYDETTDQGSLRIRLGQTIGKVKNSSGTNTDVFLYAITSEGGIVPSGNVVMTWNDDASELFFTSGVDGGAVSLAGVFVDGQYYNLVDNITYDITGFTRDMN